MFVVLNRLEGPPGRDFSTFLNYHLLTSMCQILYKNFTYVITSSDIPENRFIKSTLEKQILRAERLNDLMSWDLKFSPLHSVASSISITRHMADTD